MEIVISLIVLYVLCVVYKNWQHNQPDKIIERLELFAYEKEKSFQKDKDVAIKDMEDGNDTFIKMSGKKRYQEIMSELEEIDKLKGKIKNLNVHLQEKYKHQPEKMIENWNDYIEQLRARAQYYRNRINIHYLDNIDDLLEENNENYLKAITIENRMISQADHSEVKMLG